MMSRRAVIANGLRGLMVACVMLVAGTGTAWAEARALDAPRAAGTVGERYDGFAELRDQSQADTLGPLVAEANAARRKVYADQAAKNNMTVDQVGRIFAPQILQGAPAGTWFHQESGAWVQK
jgi:uncharacterized protein